MSLSPLAAIPMVALACATATAADLPPEIADCKIFKIWRFDQGPVLSLSKDWKPDHNVSPFEIKDGLLTFENIGPDPWILNGQLGGPDASKFRFLGIKMRSSKDGQNQVYFGTDKHAGPSEQTVVTYPITGDGKFHFYETDMSQVPTWDGKVRVLRIDTVNGADEIGARIDIEWIALYQVPARITIGRPYAGLDDRESVFASVPITNTGGEELPSGLEAYVQRETAGFGLPLPFEPFKPRETRTAKRGARKPAADIDFTVGVRGSTVAAGLIASPREEDEPACELVGESSRLQFYRCEGRVVSAGVYVEKGTGKQVRVGTLRPLATLAYKDRFGVLRYEEITADTAHEAGGQVVVESKHRFVGGIAKINWTFGSPTKDRPEFAITCALTTDAPIDILRFEGPRLLAGDRSFGASKAHAIFPGLEYLDKDEPSGAIDHIGPKFAERRIPHPYKITVPLMAVEDHDAVIGLSWDPMAEWASGHKLPCAEFESPNRSQGAKSHLMTVFVPSIPDFVNENADFAKTPFTLKPGEKITLSTALFARPGRKITDAIPDYYASSGLIKSPPIARGLDGTIALCFKAYAESLYSPEKNGWKNHFGLKQSYAPNNAFAARILAESLRKGDPELARKCKIDPGAQLSQYTGNTLDWFAPGSESWAKDVLAKQSRDGGFPYEITPDEAKRVKEIAPLGGSKATTLGDIGKTNSGLTARYLTGLLDYAIRTGQDKYIEAGLKGLDRMNRFTVPRGAQTWEVHAHTPDIYAAGLAVDANVKGYHLTGDAKYLERAKFWAYTGLPFIYNWIPPINPAPKAVFHADELGEGAKYVFSDPAAFFENPARQANPGATIPVLGTSYYVIGWFGNVVQWCGAAWADAVQRLIRLRPDPVLQAAADAVFASCTQQQFDKGWAAGTYPDSWTMTTDTANAAFIAPDVIYEYAYGLIGEKNAVATECAGFDLRGRRARLSTYGRVERFASDPGKVEVDLKFYAGQDLWTCLVPVPKPTRVAANGADLAESTDLRAAASGFYHDPATEALHIKFRPESRTAVLRIEW